MGIVLLVALWLFGLWAIVMLMRNIRMELIKQQRKANANAGIEDDYGQIITTAKIKRKGKKCRTASDDCGC